MSLVEWVTTAARFGLLDPKRALRTTGWRRVGTTIVRWPGPVLVVSVPLRPPARLLPAIVAVGLFDTTANLLVAFATTYGSAGIVAVLSALYPLTTILLARAFLSERLDRTRRVGGALALAGAALVAVG